MPPSLEHLESCSQNRRASSNVRWLINCLVITLACVLTPRLKWQGLTLICQPRRCRAPGCGPVLHNAERASRHPRTAAVRCRDLRPCGSEADLEAQLLALSRLRAAGVQLGVDMAEGMCASSGARCRFEIPAKMLSPFPHAALASMIAAASLADSVLASLGDQAVLCRTRRAKSLVGW
jgi:hypothetical protein